MSDQIVKNEKLIILDLNGTLLYRQYNKSKTILRNDTPDFVIGYFDCYLRPGLDKFIEYIFKNYTVGIWTSATKVNAIPLINKVFEKYLDKLEFILTREDCSDVKNSDDDHTSTKDVCKKIWRTSKWNELNTIIIEDSDKKHSLNKKNVVIIEEYINQVDDNVLINLIEN